MRTLLNNTYLHIYGLSASLSTRGRFHVDRHFRSRCSIRLVCLVDTEDQLRVTAERKGANELHWKVSDGLVHKKLGCKLTATMAPAMVEYVAMNRIELSEVLF